MRHLTLFLILALGVVNVYALEVPEKEKALKEKVQDEAPPQNRQEKVAPGRVKSPAPGKKYTPSEKITADSAVSFPADI